MTSPQLCMCVIVAGLALFAMTPVSTNYMIEREEMHDSRGCALFLAIGLGLATYLF